MRVMSVSECIGMLLNVRDTSTGVTLECTKYVSHSKWKKEEDGHTTAGYPCLSERPCLTYWLHHLIPAT